MQYIIETMNHGNEETENFIEAFNSAQLKTVHEVSAWTDQWAAQRWAGGEATVGYILGLQNPDINGCLMGQPGKREWNKQYWYSACLAEEVEEYTVFFKHHSDKSVRWTVRGYAKKFNERK